MVTERQRMHFISHGAGGSADMLQLAETARPRPGAGELLIEVRAAGVNRPDVAQRQGHYPPPADASPILGLEVAGTVAEVGAAVRSWQIGDRVCALAPGGGYAEYCLVPAATALPIPGSMEFADAATLPEVWFTVWANLVTMGHLRHGERVLIHGGSSGIGLAAIQLARYRGAQSVVTVGSEDKRHFCLRAGAQEAINYRTHDFVDVLGQQSVDVVLDMVGGDYIARDLQVLRTHGRLLLIAFLAGSRANVDLAAVMMKRLTIAGSTLRRRTLREKRAVRDALLRHIWPGLADGSLKHHVHATFPLREASKAHELMESSQHIGKIALLV